MSVHFFAEKKNRCQFIFLKKNRCQFIFLQKSRKKNRCQFIFLKKNRCQFIFLQKSRCRKAGVGSNAIKLSRAFRKLLLLYVVAEFGSRFRHPRIVF